MIPSEIVLLSTGKEIDMFDFALENTEVTFEEKIELSEKMLDLWKNLNNN